MAQREGYIVGLKSEGVRNIDEEGTTFNPNGLTLSCPSKPGKSLRYYTYPDAPGMIYYGYVNTPKEELDWCPEWVPQAVRQVRDMKTWEKWAYGLTYGLALYMIMSALLGATALVLADNGTGSNGCNAMA